MLWRFYKKIFTVETVTVLLFIIFCVICRFFGISCLIYNLTDIPCPTCYMSRALVSLLRFDFYQYAEYNLMALPVAVVFLCELFNRFFGKYKNILHICTGIVLAVNMVYYLMRLKYLI